MNEIEFLIENKRLTFLQLVQEIKRLNIFLKIAKEEGIPLSVKDPTTTKKNVEEFIGKMVSKNLNSPNHC